MIIIALFYDANNHMLNMQGKTLYVLKNGIMARSLRATVRVMSSCTGAKRIDVRIFGY
ncbi:MAG TPA: hypothetical protein PLT87_00255 [Spirochaetales bacterium]|nr:hypothetical protein [Spirochaetales bacterium]